MEKNVIIAIVILALVGALFYFKPFGTGIFAVTGAETVSRTLPSSVEKGSTFSLSYTANGVSGTWGGTVVDAVSGGCTVSVSGIQKTSLQFAMLSDLPNPLAYTVTSPSSIGSCVFTGDYKFGSYSTINMPTQTVSIVCTPSWTSGSWSACSAPAAIWTDKGACVASYTASGTQTRTNTDSKSCGVTTGQPVTSQACTQTYTRTVLKSTIAPLADTDCSGNVDRAEVGVAITAWTINGISREEVGLAIQAWSGGQ